MDPTADQAAPPEKRPEIKPDVSAAAKSWLTKTDNLTQRKNALWEFREANKSLFPARFNPNDPRRGQTPKELKSGRDNRRVQTPLIYRGSLQITAMSVPEDMEFEWEAKEQAQPPQDPSMPPQQRITDPLHASFGKTLRIVQRELLDEAGLIPKLRALVQDSSTYPMAIIKDTFRREYTTTSLNPNPGDRDETDGTARLQALMQQFSRKDFDQNSAEFAEMKQLLVSLRDKARITRFFGPDIQLVPMDAFGVSEECTDLVNIYDAPYMFQDALLAGTEILAKYKYRVDEATGETFGVLPDELNQATPWDTNNSSTDPNARNRSSRNKQLTAPNATPLNSISTTGTAGTDPKHRQYLVREIWSKRDRTVYVLVRGLDHFVDKFVPQKTPERWYPFTILAPNRVPTEIYQASDVELKRDIQDRIHRKRTDEEKARGLSLPRGIYNRAAGVDEKEMVRLQDVQPGQLRGINFGTQQTSINDMVQWWKYEYAPESFNTTKDEQDMDVMGALPIQALGQTGSANFATEVSVASAGATVATNYRKSIITQAIECFLAANAEVLMQELSLDEVQRIAGPFAIWPEIYDDVEAAQIVEDARMRAAEQAAPMVIGQAVQQMQLAGVPLDQKNLGRQIDLASTPLWQAEMQQKYGNIEPATRESIFRRLKVRIKSSFNSKLDKQQSIAMFAQLGEACMQIGQASAGLGVPFNMRPILQHHAELIGGQTVVDEAFPAVSPMQIAQQLAAGVQAQQPGAKGPESPAGQGSEGASVDPAGQAQNALAGAPAPMG